MAYNFSFHSVENCLPLLSRKELLSEVLVKQLHGGITRIWHYPGHIAITTDNGRKLFTFDCKPLQPQQGFSPSNLDIQNAPSSIVEVLFTLPSIITVVQENGHSKWWRCTSGFDWLYIGNMEMCNHVDSCVSSVTFIPASKMLVWCERIEKSAYEMSDSLPSIDKSVSSYCIKAKRIQTMDLTAQSLRELEVTSNNTIISNCPDCDVLAMTKDKLFIRTKPHKDQITVTLMCSADFSETILFLGQDRFNISSPTLSNSLDFSSLLLTYLPTIIKMETNYGDLGIKIHDQRLVALSSCGLMEIFNFSGSVNAKFEHKILPISLEDSSMEYGHWFLQNKHVGIIHHQKLSLYSISDGTCVYNWECDNLSSIAAVVQTSSPSFLAWILTSKGLFALQATDCKAQTAYTSIGNIPEDDLMQTAVLQLTHLHQLKQYGYNNEVLKKLDVLRDAWKEGKGSHQSQIVDMLGHLADDYWKLDDKSKVFLDMKEKTHDKQESTKVGRFTDEISKIVTLSKRARESRLLLLSQIYPEELLSHLCQGITLDNEEVNESELPRWQALLGIEGWDLSRFELVCRLLFLYHPEKLSHFVKCAESVSQKTVGVSAFIRKKHSLIFYKSASDCLPLAETSCNPPVAASAKSRLILASKMPNNIEQALKHLLQLKLWQEAVELVRSQSSNKEHLPCYLYILISALAQNCCLSQYITEIFELMPSWKSFLSFAQVASMQSEIRQIQLSTSASDLFCPRDSNICIGAVQPFLMELIKKMD